MMSIEIFLEVFFTFIVILKWKHTMVSAVRQKALKGACTEETFYFGTYYGWTTLCQRTPTLSQYTDEQSFLYTK